MHPTLRRAALIRSAPFLAFMLLLALRGWMPADNAWGVDPRWVYGLTVLVVGALLLHWWPGYAELSPPQRPGGRQVALSAAVGGAVFALWIVLDAPWMTLGEPAAPFVPLRPDGSADWPLIAIRFAGAVLVVPVMEELFWRGFLMRWVERGRFTAVPPQDIGARAVLLSTFAFVLVHNLWLAAAAAGLAYAWLYVRTGRLWCAVIAHAVTNAALGVWVVATGNWQFW
jgi:CAAX prenyl protease-like protein